MIEAAALAAGLGAMGFSARFHWWRPRRRGVPILMYHQVGPHRSGSRLNRWRVTVPDFCRQLDYLCSLGYSGGTLRDLRARPAGEGKRAVLTFDDGFAGVLHNAWPHMRARGFTGTVFVVAGRLGGINDWDQDEPGEALLSADEVRRLSEEGMEIGSHGLNHKALTDLDEAGKDRETTQSRLVLEEVTGATVESFCYPYGAFDEASVRAVARAGYRSATVIRSGINADLSSPLCLRRVPVRGTDPFLDFRIALTRGRSKF